MGQHKLKKVREDISEDLAISMETLCYQGWCEVLQLAYKKDGIAGVFQTAAAIIKYVDELAQTAEEEVPGCPRMHRAIVAAQLGNNWYPELVSELREFPDGPWYFELKNGGKTEFPKPGDELRTYSESLRIRDEALSNFDDWVRLKDSNPLAAKELVRMFSEKYAPHPR